MRKLVEIGVSTAKREGKTKDKREKNSPAGAEAYRARKAAQSRPKQHWVGGFVEATGQPFGHWEKI